MSPVEVVHPERGAITLDGYEEWESFIQNITEDRHLNMYMDQYVDSFQADLVSSEKFSAYLDNAILKTKYAVETKLEQQMHQVARVISTREARKAERETFIVNIGGFDTHQSQTEDLEELFAEIDRAIEGFVSELKAQQVFDSVLLLGQSEFGRTLSSNGDGTDHGWGGNYFAVGGGIRAEIFNEFIPTFKEGNEREIKRGRVIPGYPWESVMVPIAKWLGVESLDEVFSNLKNFDTSTHIIEDGLFFK